MEKLARLLKIWKLCKERPRNVPELARLCHVTERTIYRDIKSLGEIGVLISYSDKGYYIIEEEPLPQLNFNDKEKLVLAIALQTLPLHLDRELEQLVNSAFHKLFTHPPQAEGIIIDEKLPVTKAHVFTRLQKAINECRKVTLVEYIKLTNEIVRDRIVEPYLLVYREHDWYLVAWTPIRNGFRIYRTNRIVKLRLEIDTFERRPFDAEAFFKGSLGIMVDRPQHVVIRFTGLGKEIIKKDGRFSKSEMQEEGESLILNTVINGEAQWLRWLVGFGNEAEILEPPELREKAIRMLKEGLQRYGELG
ncbi:MAG: WYL domain-containing protein [Calditrichaeota bacterium]|nr:MAG: WYL domain-containing protein [Calditrichota bacterium]